MGVPRKLGNRMSDPLCLHLACCLPARLGAEIVHVRRPTDRGCADERRTERFRLGSRAVTWLTCWKCVDSLRDRPYLHSCDKAVN